MKLICLWCNKAFDADILSDCPQCNEDEVIVMSDIVKIAQTYQDSENFEWMLPLEDNDPHNGHYVELSLNTLAEKLDVSEYFQDAEIDFILSHLE